MTRLFATILGAAAVLAGCQGAPRPTQLPQGPAAYRVVPAPVPDAQAAARTLVPGDTISVAVYREPDLGGEKLVLDERGMVQLPLLGEVVAAGQTPAQFARIVSDRLGARYLREPRVIVALVGSVEQTVTVEGQVQDPGVFPIGRNETLLTTLARANSPTPTARLEEVVVFRTVNGQRAGAVFDLGQIRAGRAADPQLLDGDVVVVGFSQIKGAFRDFLAASPLLNLFTVF